MTDITILASLPSIQILNPGERFVVILADITRETAATGNLIFDAAIAAVCLEHGVREIVTEDQNFRRFQGIKPIRL